MGIASREKWLKMQSGPYFITFLLPETIAMQRRFFDRYLKGIDNGWEKEPRVEVELRAVDDTVKRTIAAARMAAAADAVDAAPSRRRERRRWRPAAPAARGERRATRRSSEGVTFTTAPMERDTEIAGPVKLKLHVASTTDDMDMFATLRAFDARRQGDRVLQLDRAQGAGLARLAARVAAQARPGAHAPSTGPTTPMTQTEKLTPGEVYEIDVEIWPTSVALPKGHRLALTLQGRDFDRPGETRETGTGWFTHEDPRDRPPAQLRWHQRDPYRPGAAAISCCRCIPPRDGRPVRF